MLATRKRSLARLGCFVLISARPLVIVRVRSPWRASRTTPGARAARGASASRCNEVCERVLVGVPAAAALTSAAAVSEASVASAIVLRRFGGCGVGWKRWLAWVIVFSFVAC